MKARVHKIVIVSAPNPCCITVITRTTSKGVWTLNSLNYAGQVQRTRITSEQVKNFVRSRMMLGWKFRWLDQRGNMMTSKQ